MSDSTDQTPEQIMQALAAPFEASEVKFKPGVISGNRALALHYVDARVVQDRLDDVLGVAGWQDDYQFLDGGEVVCRLKVRIGGEWLTKVDVGGESEQPDGGDRKKAAVSDALKRAAVKFGIGRYLYRLPSQWVEYDPQKKQIKSPPQLPAFAQPEKKPAAPKKAGGPEKAAEPAPAKKAGDVPADLPANGPELHARLDGWDQRLAAERRIRRGELLEHIVGRATAHGHPADLKTWTDRKLILRAWDAAGAFAEAHKEALPDERPGKGTVPAKEFVGGKAVVGSRQRITPEQVAILEELCNRHDEPFNEFAAGYVRPDGTRKETLDELTGEEYLHAVTVLKNYQPTTA